MTPSPAGLMALNTAFKTEEPIPEGKRPGNGDDFDYVTREGTIRFRPNYFEIRDDRVLAFRDQVLLRLPPVRVLLPGRVRGQVYGARHPGGGHVLRRE